MRTQLEVNHYLQDTTIKNAQNLLDIEKCLENDRLYLPNNVIIHKNGIGSIDFIKWFENRSFKAGDVLVTEHGNIVLFSHIDKDDIVYYHCLMTPSRFSIKLDCGVGKIYNCSLASESQRQKLFEKLYKSGCTYNVITNSLELIIQKFDISILKPFDKVLVRDYDYEQWSTAVYSHKQDDHFVASGHFKQCIPYKNNKHLLGTTDDCDEFYKIWK